MDSHSENFEKMKAKLNERIFNGSIIPSIVLHGTGNFIASMLMAFA